METPVQIQQRAEGEEVPEGVSCTETEDAYYLRVRKFDRVVLVKIMKADLRPIIGYGYCNGGQSNK